MAGQNIQVGLAGGHGRGVDTVTGTTEPVT